MRNDRPRCPHAIHFGVKLHTRCELGADHAGHEHAGPGLEQFPYQKVVWFTGDRREYMTQVDLPHAWELEE